MAVLNIVNVATINGYSKSVAPANTSRTQLLAAPTTNYTYKIKSIVAANVTAVAATATVEVYDGTTYFPLAYQISVPGNSSLIVVDASMGLYTVDAASDGSGVPSEIHVTSGTSSAIAYTVTYELLA